MNTPQFLIRLIGVIGYIILIIACLVIIAFLNGCEPTDTICNNRVKMAQCEHVCRESGGLMKLSPGVVRTNCTCANGTIIQVIRGDIVPGFTPPMCDVKTTGAQVTEAQKVTIQ